MNRLGRTAAIIGLLAMAGCAAAGLPDPRTMSFPAVSLSPPEPARRTTANGTVLFTLEDREVPLVNIRVMVRAGSVLDPPGKTGLADVAGTVMRSGGTAAHDGPALNEVLENMGATLEISMGREAGWATLSVLSEDLDRGLGLLAEVLRFPRFDAAEFEREKNRVVEEIRRRNDDPDSIAFRELRKVLYGNDPRGRSPSPEGIRSLSRGDLEGFHRRFFHPDRLIAGVSGDFDGEHLLALWEKYFGDWKPAGGDPSVFPVPGDRPRPGVYVSPKAFPQATVVFGRFAPSLESEDYYASVLLNYIFGGAGFNSRLMEEIRSNRGLAYSVGSWYRAEKDYGILVAWCRTAPSKAAQAAGLVLDIARTLRGGGVTERDLAWAKEAIVNNLIFSVDSTAEILSRKMSYEYRNLPPDFLERYPERIGDVTLEEVNGAAARYLVFDKAPLVVVGVGEAAREEFSLFGPVEPIPLEEY